MCQGNRFNQTNPETDPSTALAQAHDRLSHKHPTLLSQAHLKKPEMLVWAKVLAVMRGCRGSLPGCYYAVAMAFRESLLQILGCLPTGSCTYHPSLSMISQEAVVTVMTGMFFGMGPESVCLQNKAINTCWYVVQYFRWQSSGTSLITSALWKTQATQMRSPAVRDQCIRICDVHGCIHFTAKYICFIVSY